MSNFKMSIKTTTTRVKFYNIVKGDTPGYLSDLLPRTVNQANNYNLRNANSFTNPRCRLTLYKNSFFPATIHLWNNLP